MSNVWLAEHTMLDRHAAIKVLRPELSSEPEGVAQFFNEARVTAAVANPGVVQIFDFGFHIDGSAYIVMERLAGETIDRRLARFGAFAIGDALRVVRQAATALAAVHAHGIVHRDLKPDNIFLVPDPEIAGGERAKILDFGIAIRIGDPMAAPAAGILGTPCFMSPEQCRGAKHVDQRSDIYSLGCVLFTLLTGRIPFEGAGSAVVMAMHLREPTPAPSRHAIGIPAAIDHLVLRCMAKDPAQRYTASELAGAIDALLQAPELAATLGRTRARSSGEPSPDMMPTLPSMPQDVMATMPPRRSVVVTPFAALA
jgi:serine/threonine-protein kinase